MFSPKPTPRAVIRFLISSLARILSARAFSTLRILPRSGRIAWNRRSRPALAVPPAESPSTMKISQSEGSRSLQSASLPGSVADSSSDLRCTSSRARAAAWRARAAVVGHVAAGVQVLDERLDATLEVEGVGALAGLVAEDDGDALVEERQLAQPRRDRFPAEGDLREDLRVGPEAHHGAVPVGPAGHLDRA